MSISDLIKKRLEQMQGGAGQKNFQQVQKFPMSYISEGTSYFRLLPIKGKDLPTVRYFKHYLDVHNSKNGKNYKTTVLCNKTEGYEDSSCLVCEKYFNSLKLDLKEDEKKAMQAKYRFSEEALYFAIPCKYEDRTVIFPENYEPVILSVVKKTSENILTTLFENEDNYPDPFDFDSGKCLKITKKSESNGSLHKSVTISITIQSADASIPEKYRYDLLEKSKIIDDYIKSINLEEQKVKDILDSNSGINKFSEKPEQTQIDPQNDNINSELNDVPKGQKVEKAPDCFAIEYSALNPKCAPCRFNSECSVACEENLENTPF